MAYEGAHSVQKGNNSGENVVTLTEKAYISVYTSIYLLIPMKPQNKICTAVREGSTQIIGGKNQHFLRSQRSKLKECGLSLLKVTFFIGHNQETIQ